MVSLNYLPHGTENPLYVGLSSLFQETFLQLTGTFIRSQFKRRRRLRRARHFRQMRAHW